ncbi:hypothetical protein TNCV_4710691 [Trichonephila clavipes]|uniref:Uncharacterized protein n=1 Tax=Trichonephila clavipes TaxID=2585209 RepID=A0A8X6RZL3_TRICX|nr:hypothetical protein TNCV_4710691 [Trichonephila clavipes]
MAAVEFLHQENPPTGTGVEPATLGIEGQRQTNYAAQLGPVHGKFVETENPHFGVVGEFGEWETRAQMSTSSADRGSKLGCMSPVAFVLLSHVTLLKHGTYVVFNAAIFCVWENRVLQTKFASQRKLKVSDYVRNRDLGKAYKWIIFDI